MLPSTKLAWFILAMLAITQQGFSSIIKYSKYCNPDNQVQARAEKERSQPIEHIECGEVVAYLMALHRYYGRRCSRMGAGCWDKDAYPVKWFDQIVQTMTAVCQRMNAEAAAKMPKEQRDLEGRCVARNHL